MRSLLLAAMCLGALAARASEDAPVPGLDHVIVAVRDLDSAAERYRALGFTLKPGRPHANGIRNQHAKFPDGSEIELITAAEERDALTRTYRKHLEEGDGPAFAALFAPHREALARRLEAAAIAIERSGALLTFPDGSAHRPFFFGGRNHSPTDRPEHFRHANGAEALIGVWIAGGDSAAYRTLLATSGARVEPGEVRIPDRVNATIARFAEGEVILLPASRQIVNGRAVIGATVRTSSLARVRETLAASGFPLPAVVAGAGSSSIFVPPELANGLWIEFREAGTAAALAPAAAKDVYSATIDETGAKTPNISTAEMEALAARGAIILDARPRLEWAVSHIPGALNVAPKPRTPMSVYVSDVKEVERLVSDRKRTIVLYCNGPFCGKSRRLAEELLGARYADVRRYQLGAPVWRALGNVMVIEPEGVRYVRDGDRTAVFIDARDPEEFAAAPIEGTGNLAASRLPRERDSGEIKAAKDDGRLPMNDHNTRIVVFGRDGRQARAVAAAIAREAFHNVAYFEGTFAEFRAAIGSED